ncbi:MAG: alpha/beta hydrolase [Gemmatimonadaceae bacterium]|nr:alpha/beta hydrolase [Gemmatimonadaceae bacterium]
MQRLLLSLTLLACVVGVDPLAAQAAPDLPLSAREFASLWKTSPADFTVEWDQRLSRALARVDSVRAPADSLTRERVRLRFRHAFGRIAHPWFNWREGDALRVGRDTAGIRMARALPLADRTWWDQREHTELVMALVHEEARELLRTANDLKRGDARWLRAELRAARGLGDSALTLHVASRLVSTWVDENGSRGTESSLVEWRALKPDEKAVRRVDSLVSVDREQRNGHVIVPYRRVDGVALEAHILEGEGPSDKRGRPAMLWLHGGSFTSGTWWHSPVLVSSLRKDGVTVVAVDLRTGNRFDGGPVEQFEDAVAAYAWIKANARKHGIDATRIGVAGFSSGATLALLTATRGVGVYPGKRTYPAAVMVMGACADPAGPEEDGFFRRSVVGRGAVSDWSPSTLVARGQSPVLAIHATKDEYCAFDDMRRFIERSAATGNSAKLVSVEGVGHFFGFYHPPGQRQARMAVANALREWQWTAQRDTSGLHL